MSKEYIELNKRTKRFNDLFDVAENPELFEKLTLEVMDCIEEDDDGIVISKREIAERFARRIGEVTQAQAFYYGFVASELMHHAYDEHSKKHLVKEMKKLVEKISDDDDDKKPSKLSGILGRGKKKATKETDEDEGNLVDKFLRTLEED